MSLGFGDGMSPALGLKQRRALLDIAQGEKVEGELNILIERRHDHRRTEEGERPAEEAWRESERLYQAKRRAELVFAWVQYHEEAAQRALANGEAIAARHRAQIEVLLSDRSPSHNGH